jgi:hypothetical protein
MTTQPRWFTTAALMFASGAIAIGAMALPPAPANAKPTDPNPKRTEKDIKQDCEGGAGGTYGSAVDKKGNRHSTCSYLDSDGNGWTDNYTSGVYTGTTGPYRPKQPTPPPTVILPPGLNQTGIQ